MDMNKMDRIKTDDLKMRPDVFELRLRRRARLRDAINDASPDIDKAVADFKLDEYYDRALNLVASGRARTRSTSRRSPRPPATFMAATPLAKAACWHVASLRPAHVWSRWSGPRSRTPTTTLGTCTLACPSA